MPTNNIAADPGLPKSASTEAYWQCPPHAIASHQSQELPDETTVVIIGSGITAASVAHHLLQICPSLSVVMLEARTISSGATGRNGGHCKDVSFKTYSRLKTQYGRKAAMQLVRFRRSHVDATRRLAREVYEEGFGDGQFRDVESVTAVFDQEVFRDFRSNLEALLEDFPEDRGRYLVLDGQEAQKKYGIIGATGVIASPAAALWPYRLVTGVLNRLLRKRQYFSLEALTPVTAITASKESSSGYLVHTHRGTIRAQHVVHCTNGYASHLLPAFRNMIVPIRGQMTAFSPSDSFARVGDARSWSMSWANGGFDYMTQARDAEGLVFLGGGVEQAAHVGVVDFGSVDDSSLNKPALRHLCSVLPEYFHGGKDATLKQAWTGIMGFTPDSLPFVGKVPQELSSTKAVDGGCGHEWIAAGFSGYGMVHCWQSGRAVADMISERRMESINDYFPTELFQCSRHRLETMDPETFRALFYKNAPTPITSRM